MTAADRPTPPAPAAEDDAVRRAARAIYEHEEVSEGDDGTLRCITCGEVIDGLDETRDGASHQARKALDAAGVSALRAEVERLRERVGEFEEDRDDWVQVAGERAGQRDQARQQVADLRAGIEALAERWEPSGLAVARDLRALAGSGDAESPTPNVATSEGRDKAVATSGEQPGACDGCGHPDDGNCNCPLTYDPAKAVPSRPAPVVPDSTGLRQAVYRALDDTRGWHPSAADQRLSVLDDLTDAVLAVVGQGVTAAQAWDECVQAVAWAMDNGPDPLRYVAEHNPYRAVVRSGEQGGEEA